MEEVANHNRQGDVWLVFRRRVYDISQYSRYHPGGVGEIMRGAGRDATAMFMEAHPWVNPDALLRDHVVGVVRDCPEVARSPLPLVVAPAAPLAPVDTTVLRGPVEWVPVPLLWRRNTGTVSVLFRFSLSPGTRLV